MKIDKKFAPPRLCVIIFLITLPCFAENEVSLRLAPAVEAPMGLEQFKTGFGAVASLDWAFFTIGAPSSLNNVHFGLYLAGNYSGIPAQAGDPLAIMEGRAGLFARWLPFDRWSFRLGLDGGVYQYSRGDDSAARAMLSFSLGGDFRLSPYFSLFADGIYSYRTFVPEHPLSTLGASAGIRINLSEIMGGRSRVKAEKTEQYRVFPVSWAWYEYNPVAMISITNEEPNAITDINLSFFMDSFMSQPWNFAALPRLGPGESAEVPVSALFNEAMLNLTENVNANGLIRMQYRSLGMRKDASAPIQMPIFHRNTLSWDDDRRAAAFVSTRDSAMRMFARYTAGAVEAAFSSGTLQTGNFSARSLPSNVCYAAALFEALRLYGISYVVVPATSFRNVSADESVLDNVSYPYQALYYRGGDCSYLSILFCSLLETLNIESAFITIPGHIYIAFELGDNNWLHGNSDIIELDGKRWLPLEITVPGEGFNRAWRIGARQWRSNGDNAVLYPIRDAWKVYPPVTVPNSGDHLPEMPERSEIVNAMYKELLIIGK